MKWLARMEYRYGARAPKNLMLVVAGGQIAAWLVIMLFYSGLYNWIQLTRAGLLRLELWRLVTFVFCPMDLTTNPLFFALEVYLTFIIGISLERAWGSFKFDVYFLLGMAGAWVGCLLTGYGSVSSLYYSLFFAFAWLFPDHQLLLFFVLPVKVKWLGLAAGALYLLNLALLLVTLHFAQAAALVVGLAGFLVFFGPGAAGQLKNRAEARRRRRQWQNQWRGR